MQSLEHFRERLLEVAEVACNAAVSSFQTSMVWHQALDMTGKMMQRSVKTDVLTVLALVGAGRSWEQNLILLGHGGISDFPELAAAWDPMLANCEQRLQSSPVPGLLHELARVEWQFFTDWQESKAKMIAFLKATHLATWQRYRCMDGTLMRRSERQPVPDTKIQVLAQLTRQLSHLARHARWQNATAAVQLAEHTTHFTDIKAETAKISALGKCGRWVAAWTNLQRFDSSLRPDAAMLNVLLSSCAESKGWRSGLDILQIFLEKGIVLTARTAIKVIPLTLWSSARELLLRLGHQVEMNVVVCNAAVAAGVHHLSDFYHWKLEPDLISFNTIADLRMKAGRWHQAQQTLQHAEDLGIERDILSFNIQLSSCPWRRVAALVQQGGLQLDLLSFSSTVAACERWSHWLPALQVFHSQRHHSILPDLISYNSVASACSKGQSWSYGLHFFGELLSAETRRADSVEIAGTAVLAACKKNEEMREEGQHPIAGSDSEEWTRCLDLLKLLHVRRVADIAAFTATLLACGKAMKMTKCQHILHEMEDMTPQVPLAAVNVQMMLHQVSGQWQDALQLLSSCASNSIRCDVATLLGATEALAMSWRRAVMVMKTLELREMKPDVAVCST
eukprot:symbB.v1.2.012555.t1/scaffold836.1/size159045/1